MNSEKSVERDLFEVEVRKSPSMAGEAEEYAFLALQRAPDGGYSATWIRSAWMGWQMARAQPAQPASTGSIGDDAEFARLMEAWDNAWVLDNDSGNGFKSANASLIAHIDSRPRQAVQQASAEAQEPICVISQKNLLALKDGCSSVSINSLDSELYGDVRLYAAIAPQAPDTVRDDALEDAAKACNAERVESTGTRFDDAYNMATADCAASIRALKSSAPKQADGEGQ